MCSYGLLRRLEYLADRVHELLPRPGLGAQLCPSHRGQAIDLGPSLRVGELPARFHPAALLEPVQRGIQRALADLEDFTRQLLDPARDGVPVRGAPRQRLEDEEIERALEQID